MRWHLSHGLAFGRVERYAEALPHYEAALAHQPDAGLVRLSAAHALRKLQRYAEAAAILQPVLDRAGSPGVEAHLMLAEIRFQQGDRQSAIRHYQEVLRREPQRSQVRQTLAWLLATTGRFPEAVVELRRLVNENPDNAQARMLLGMALIETGDRVEGERQVRAAVAQDPALREMARAAGVSPQALGPDKP